MQMLSAGTSRLTLFNSFMQLKPPTEPLAKRVTYIHGYPDSQGGFKHAPGALHRIPRQSPKGDLLWTVWCTAVPRGVLAGAKQLSELVYQVFRNAVREEDSMGFTGRVPGQSAPPDSSSQRCSFLLMPFDA